MSPPLHPVGFWSEGGPSLSASPVGGSVFRTNITTSVYARVRFGTDGTEYWSPISGSSATTSSQGAWMDSGTSDQYWVQQSITSGSLSTTPGTGRYPLTSDRTFGVVDTTTSGGSVSCSVTFNFYDADSGGNLVGTADYTLTAFREP